MSVERGGAELRHDGFLRRQLRSRARLTRLVLLVVLSLIPVRPTSAPNDPWALIARAERLRRLQGEHNLRAAQACYLRALSVDGSLTPAVRITAWTELGHVESLLGDVKSEIAHYEAALRLARRDEDAGRLASVLNDLGRARRQNGDLRAARGAYQEALAAARQAGRTNEEATAVNNLARLDYIAGDADRAIHLYEQALTLWRQARVRSGEAITLANLGEAYVVLGRPDDALDFFDRALRIHVALGNDADTASAWTLMGWARFAVGDSEGALAAYRRAITLSEKAGDVVGRAAALDRLGTAYRKLQRYDESYGAYRQALEISTRSGAPLALVHTRFNLCELFLDWRKPAAAAPHCRVGQNLLTTLHDRNVASHGWFLTARLAHQQGDVEQAQESVEKALALVDDLGREPGSPALRSSFLAARRTYFDFLLDLLLDRHGSNPQAGRDHRAFELAERMRTRGLVDGLLAADRHDGDGDSHAARQRREQELRLQIEDLVPQTPGADLSDRYRLSRLRSLRRRREALLATPSASREVPAQLFGGTLGLEQAQQVIDGGTTLLVYAVGERRSAVWLVETGRIETHLLPGRQTLTAIVSGLQTLLEKTPSPSAETELRLSLEQASKALLGPLAGRLSGQRLVVVPDGPLHRLSFAVLPEPGSAGRPRPLLAAHEITYIPSLSAQLVAARLAEDGDFDKEVLVAADPVFAASDPRVRAAPPPAERERAAGGASGERAGWRRLPGTRLEALRIRQLLGPQRSTLLLDFDASRERVLGEIVGHRIVHLATHGQFNDTFPELSGVALSLVDRGGDERRGFLRIQDLYTAPLGGDLVILSGCRTGSGAELYGQGLVGFFQALMVGGTRQLVANLWDADDDATAELMAGFYEQMFLAGRAPAAALREAQLALSRSPRWHAPHYWAGFRIQGDRQLKDLARAEHFIPARVPPE